MRTTFKVSFFLKRDAKQKNDSLPILARITVNGNAVHFVTQQRIAPEAWSVAQNKAIGRSAEANKINETLEGIKATLLKHYFVQQEKGNVITAEKLKNIFLGQDETNLTLLVLFQQHNDDIKKLIGKNVTLSTHKKYELAMRRVSEFLQFRYKVSDMAIKDLNLNFIRDYELFLRTSCSLSNNVAAKMIMFLKKIVTLAFNNGIITSNPFANFHIKLTKVDRGYLTKEELEIIIRKPISVKRLDLVRNIFVFCCFTGLAYIDVKHLKQDDIRMNFDDRLWIMTKRHKTNIPINVLLLDIPNRIIENYKEKSSTRNVLPVMSNQITTRKCNRARSDVNC